MEASRTALVGELFAMDADVIFGVVRAHLLRR